MQVNRRHVDCALAKEGDDVSNGRGQTRPTKASACAIVKIGGGKVARQLEYPGASGFCLPFCLFDGGIVERDDPRRAVHPGQHLYFDEREGKLLQYVLVIQILNFFPSDGT